MREMLKKKKSYILAGIMFVHGLVTYLVGDQTFMEMVQGSQAILEMFGGASMATYRAAIDV